MHVQTYPQLIGRPNIQAGHWGWMNPAAFIHFAAQCHGQRLWGLEVCQPRNPDPNP